MRTVQLTCECCGDHLGFDLDIDRPEEIASLLRRHTHYEGEEEPPRVVREDAGAEANRLAAERRAGIYMGIAQFPHLQQQMAQATEEQTAKDKAGRRAAFWKAMKAMDDCAAGLARTGAEIAHATVGPSEFAMEWEETAAVDWEETAAVDPIAPVATPRPLPLHLDKRFRMLVNERLPAHLLGAAWTVRKDGDFTYVDVVGWDVPLLLHKVELELAGVGKE